MKLFSLCLVVLFAVTACANELPDSPVAKPALAPKFWSKEQSAAFSVFVAAATVDVAQTCRSLAHGGQEDWMPTQRCPVLAVGGVVAIGAVLISEYELHRHQHYKLERIVRFAAPVANMAGIISSARNGMY